VLVVLRKLARGASALHDIASMSATAEATLEDVLEAGRVLFGPAFGGARAPGWRDALRAAYRRRALETHPDRARSLGRGEAELAREFRAVVEAYRVLSTLSRWPAAPVARPAAPARPAQRHGPADPHARRARTEPPPDPRARRAAPEPARPASAPHVRVRVGLQPDRLPRRRLKLAEYLYYAGRVPWSAFVDAIAWQRAQRPPVGRVAVDFGFLAPEDVREILERRRADGATAVPFGEYAVAAGFLTPFQLLASLGQQLRLQRRIGAFFVERGLLDAEELEEARRRLARHNARQASAGGAAAR